MAENRSPSPGDIVAMTPFQMATAKALCALVAKAGGQVRFTQEEIDQVGRLRIETDPECGDLLVTFVSCDPRVMH